MSMHRSTTKVPMTMDMTSPISLDGPTRFDLQRTQELEDALKLCENAESDEGLHQRLEVLRKLNALVKQWIRDVSIKTNMPCNVAENAGGKIFTFGSYRLGIHTKGADIDTLCVAPRHIERRDFFTSFYQLLKKQPEVTELRAIEAAFVPLIKMNFSGIEMDVLFARLALKTIPEDQDLSEETVLQNLNVKCVRSLNGCRVAEEILRLVPNHDNFRTALRVIKLWAKKRGIYSNVLGYLGGISWAMLVARTCQLYPNAVAATLIHKFFLVFSQWKWPSPVLLKAPHDSKLGHAVWDPKTDVQDRYHLMPIVTPAYPQQNSTFNVSLSTRSIIVDELKKGLTTVQDIISGESDWSKLFDSPNFFEQYKYFIAIVTPAYPQQNSTFNVSLSTRSIIVDELKKGLTTVQDIISGESDWSKLFDSPNFFEQYKYFIAIIVSAASEVDLLAWQGFVESKIRLFTKALERKWFVTLARINPESYPSLDTSPGRHVSTWFIGLSFNMNEQSEDLTNDIYFFVRKVLYSKAIEIKLLKKGMRIEVKPVRRGQLNSYLAENV